ncbi:TPA: hypothetical protein ACXI1D_003365 [Proteus mirabilis]
MFGLVNANDNQQEVGGYLIRISSVEIDGKKVSLEELEAPIGNLPLSLKML